MKIDGVPDGWELVRIGRIQPQEWWLDITGTPAHFTKTEESDYRWPIIRRAEPHCTWQHGQFKDGWVAEDVFGIHWYSEPPKWFFVKPSGGNPGWGGANRDIDHLIRIPVFRSSLPWNERIQQVGPTYEATLRGET